jgi:DNA gyrase subunit A
MQIKERLVQEEMKESYIDYAMSVIMQRALPDVRDGLKPVHRRILYSMYEMGLLSNKVFKKSATIVGQCLGRFHPHGDQSVYDALVRMAQDFSLRYPLVHGQGNWGSIDGDSAAAYRYTEAKLKKIAEELLQDIEKNTVDLIPNFDNSLKEPVVLPSKVPNLLINGSSGIAVGMATNIPPHNISEVIKAVIHALDNESEAEDLMQFIKGPDFPTGASILGTSGIRQAYKTGRGKVKIRSKVKLEKDKIIVYEIPYMVNKSLLMENIADLIKDKRLEGISDLRDESSRNEIRVVIELKKSANAEVVLNNLYKNTQLETTFGINIVALHGNEPKIMNLKDLVYYFIDHRKDVVTRRTKFELEKAEGRKHILEGILIALENIDNVVELIKKSKDIANAKEQLINNYNLSEKQAVAILDMKLSRLTNLEQDKLKKEHKILIELIIELKGILDSEIKLKDVIRKELNELLERYSDERRTEILNVSDEIIEDEDLIKEENVVITFTNDGYIKLTKLDEYLSNILLFTNMGRIHWIKAYQIPLGTKYGKGKAIVNLVDLGKDEKISSILSLKDFREGYLIFCTRNGILKKSDVKLYSNPRKGGINAIGLKEDDEVVEVLFVENNEELVIGTKNGLAMRFNEKDVKSVGRGASGVIGIRLKNDYVVGMVRGKGSLFSVTENGYGKRSDINDYRLVRRGGKGVLNIKTKFIYDDSRNEGVVGIKNVFDDDELMFITMKGITIRVKVNQFKNIGRNTSGIRLIKLDENDKVVSMAKVVNGE